MSDAPASHLLASLVLWVALVLGLVYAWSLDGGAGL